MDSRLPDLCYSQNNVDESLIIIKKGESGYYLPYGSERKTTVEEVNALNDNIDVTVAQRMAMEHGSMFGWNVPASNVDTWEKVLTRKANTDNI